jgi:hypothetical protein
VQDSNLRPPACKAGALPAELTALANGKDHTNLRGSRIRSAYIGRSMACIWLARVLDARGRARRRTRGDSTLYPAGWVAGLDGGLLAGEDFGVFRFSAFRDVPGPRAKRPAHLLGLAGSCAHSGERARDRPGRRSGSGERVPARAEPQDVRVLRRPSRLRGVLSNIDRFRRDTSATCSASAPNGIRTRAATLKGW